MAGIVKAAPEPKRPEKRPLTVVSEVGRTNVPVVYVTAPLMLVMLAAVKVVDPAVWTIFGKTCAAPPVEIVPPLLVNVLPADIVNGMVPKVSVPFTIIPAMFEVGTPSVRVCPLQMVKVSTLGVIKLGLTTEVPQSPVDQCVKPVKSA